MMMADDNGGDIDSSVDLQQLQSLDKKLAREKFLQTKRECDARFETEKSKLATRYGHVTGTRWYDEEKKVAFQQELEELRHDHALLIKSAHHEYSKFWNEVRSGERLTRLIESSHARFPHRYDYDCCVCGAKIYPNRSICGSCGEPQ